MRYRRLAFALILIVAVVGLIALIVSSRKEEKQAVSKTEHLKKSNAVRERWEKHVAPLPDRHKEHGERILEATQKFPADKKPLPLEKVEEAERWLKTFREDLLAAEKMLPEFEQDFDRYFEGEEQKMYKELLKEVKESIPRIKEQVEETVAFWRRYRAVAGYKPR